MVHTVILAIVVITIIVTIIVIIVTNIIVVPLAQLHSYITIINYINSNCIIVVIIVCLIHRESITIQRHQLIFSERFESDIGLNV